MTASSLPRPWGSSPVTQALCPIFARIESFTNKDKNLDRADNNSLLTNTFSPLFPQNGHIITKLCRVWCSDLNCSWSDTAQLLITDHSMKGRHETWHRHGCWSQHWMRALCCQQWFLAPSWCLICWMLEEEKHQYKYSAASISDLCPRIRRADREQRRETLMSWCQGDQTLVSVSQWEASIRCRDQSEASGGSRNTELILIKCQVWASGMFCSVRENARNYTSPRKKIKMKDAYGNKINSRWWISFSW